MKRSYLLAALAAVLTFGSCSNDQEVINKKEDNEKAINFRSFIDKGVASRATVTTSNNIRNFTVTGWWDKTGDITTGTQGDITAATDENWVFNAVDISRREAGIDDWTYDRTRYWPSAEIIGGGISFFAYSPAAANVTNGKGLKDYKGGVLEYTVPNPQTQAEIRVTPQDDFLLARTNPLKEGKVALDFVHALSRAKFYARTTKPNLTYVINSIEMLGLAMKGTIDLKDVPVGGIPTDFYSDAPSSTPVTLWTADASSKDKLVLDMGATPLNLQGDYASLHGESTALMVLPQTTSLGDPTITNAPADGNFLIKIEYKAYLNNPDGTYYAGEKNKWETVYFSVLDALRSDATTKPHTFEFGRQYNFYFTFGHEVGDGIKFDVGVGNWSDVPPTHLPQIDYWNDGLISEQLAAKANPNYASKGVTLNDILNITNMDVIVNEADGSDFKGLDFFTNLKKVTFKVTKDGLNVVVPSLPLLTEVEIKATYAVNPNLDMLDISKVGSSLTRVNFQTGEDSSDYFGRLTINNVYIWKGFDQADTATLFDTAHSYKNYPSLTIKKMYIDNDTVGVGPIVVTKP